MEHKPSPDVNTASLGVNAASLGANTATSTNNASPNTAQLFRDHIKREADSGNMIISAENTDDDQVVVFADGSRMELLKTGHFLRKYANGTTLQCNPDGKMIKVHLPSQHTQ